ncbi:fatty acyl-CoA reductase wat-like [Topomyia yanbarensis]|uniref:fatty acyl-CoA reductase wat-like n=1 Tax=Topomyia yanbarensis TaxID=2498891 RepID=UPI00273BF1A5|nr:fatty acyl-CoA reductase wat-like [Topomyia yanbarensis]
MSDHSFTNDYLENNRPNGLNTPMGLFFRGKTVFLTGGTGFLGKLFIEKLLRCDVREIILLIRNKRDRTPRERLRKQLEREAIYVSYAKDPDYYWDRLRIVEGALQHSELGLAEKDLDYLRNNVDIVIHSAADVRFEVSLKTSIKTNVFGANELLQIALGMKKLVSFLYISTAYSNCIRDVVEEKFYDMGVDPMMLIRLVDMADEHELNALTKKITQPWPNTYTFAKALAESVLRSYCERLPVAVIRPSIIIGTVRDPIEGWADNLYALNGAIVGFGCGVLRVVQVYEHCHFDIIPADLVVNSSLAIVWYTTEHKNRNTTSTENVFNCTCRSDNPITFTDGVRYAMSHRNDFPPVKTLWYPSVTMTASATVNYILQLLYHVLPAMILDLLARLKGMEPRVLFLYRKARQFSDVLTFFCLHEWIFHNDKMRMVHDSMSQQDRDFFPANVKNLKWGDFFRTYVLGVRKYIIRESLDNLEQAKKKFFKLKIAHGLLIGCLYFGLLVIVYLFFRGLLARCGIEQIVIKF